MPYTYLWTPSSIQPNADSKINIYTSEGQPVPGATFTTSTRQINVTVPEKGRYRLRIRTGSQAEEVTVSIPASSPLPNLYDRLNTLETRSVSEPGHTHATTDVTGLQAALDAKQGVLQDTGWRRMPLGTGVGGTVLVRRLGPIVHVNLVGVTTTTAGDNLLAATPVGFQGTAHSVNVNTFLGRMLSGTSDLHLVYNSTNTALYGLGMEATTATVTVAYNGGGMYFTTDAFPTTLPGTAV